MDVVSRVGYLKDSDEQAVFNHHTHNNINTNTNTIVLDMHNKTARKEFTPKLVFAAALTLTVKEEKIVALLPSISISSYRYRFI